jgi:rhodanese-related sulfurtransferase
MEVVEITLQEARSNIANYGAVIWTHPRFVPNQEGVKLISSALGVEENKVKITSPRDLEKIVYNQEFPERVRSLVPTDQSKVLLVCMVGNASLRVAKQLARMGVNAESLTGGIMGMPEASAKHPSELVQLASD